MHYSTYQGLQQFISEGRQKPGWSLFGAPKKQLGENESLKLFSDHFLLSEIDTSKLSLWINFKHVFNPDQLSLEWHKQLDFVI